MTDAFKNKVVVHVSRGVADIAGSDPNVDVFLLDFDNFVDVPNMGSKRKHLKCSACQEESTEWDWNAATIGHDDCDESKIVRVQDIEFSGSVQTLTNFSCPRCFNRSTFSELVKVDEAD